MKLKIIFLIIVFSITGINSQDTVSYSGKDITAVFNEVKTRNEKPEIQEKIKKLESFESILYQMRKDTAYKLSDGNMRPEFFVIEKVYLDSMLKLFNYSIDSIKLFRTDCYTAEEIINHKYGGYSKQLFFLLFEKIIPSYFVFFKEFRNIYSAILKKIGDGECCNGK